LSKLRVRGVLTRADIYKIVALRVKWRFALTLRNKWRRVPVLGRRNRVIKVVGAWARARTMVFLGSCRVVGVPRMSQVCTEGRLRVIGARAGLIRNNFLRSFSVNRPFWVTVQDRIFVWRVLSGADTRVSELRSSNLPAKIWRACASFQEVGVDVVLARPNVVSASRRTLEIKSSRRLLIIALLLVLVKSLVPRVGLLVPVA